MSNKTGRPKGSVKVAFATCSECAEEFQTNSYQRTYFNATGRIYCSKTCSSAYRSRISSETMARTNRKYASARMIERNPMRREEVRASVSRRLKEIGHQPKVRGGNGREATIPEQYLNLMFADLGFEAQPNIRTGMSRGSGYPTVYKPDLGNWSLKIALEADGSSHHALERQAQDRKKDAFLTGLGWTVLRFSNQQILEAPEQVFATVMSTISKLKASTLTLPTA